MSIENCRCIFLNHSVQNCGVHQFGESIYSAISNSTDITYIYAECINKDQLDNILSKNQNLDLMIVNFHPDTMPWLNRKLIRALPFPCIGIIHEFDHHTCFSAGADIFDFRVFPDPTIDVRMPTMFATSRLAPTFATSVGTIEPSIPIIGSFGFGTPGKGFEKIIKLVEREFDEALIRLLITPNFYYDQDGTKARDIGRKCFELVSKPGVRLEVSHEFLEENQLIKFLSENSVNVFLYDYQEGRGIASVIDKAVAAGKPIAVSDSNMFRHIRTISPLFRVEEVPLSEIISFGAQEVQKLKKHWTAENLTNQYNDICRKVLSLWDYINDLSVPHYNTILNDIERNRYSSSVSEMKLLAPVTMTRKIERANVQQAFVKEAVQKFVAGFPREANILCVGSFDDTASESLRMLGFNIKEIDPVVNYDLDTFYNLPSTLRSAYNIIFSTSVIEHVPDDEKFIEQIRELLSPGGIAILTMDFKEGYRHGDPKPLVDMRLYTLQDLLGRFLPLLDNCELIDAPTWRDAVPDFVYENVQYSFATFVFQKKIS